MGAARTCLIFLTILCLPLGYAFDLNNAVQFFLGFPVGSEPPVDLTGNYEFTTLPRPEPVISCDNPVDGDHLTGNYTIIPTGDMGDNFTICSYFNQTRYSDALISTYGAQFERSGGAFELYVNNYDPVFPQFGVILDDDDNFIEIDTVGMNYSENQFHFVCATYDGGNTPAAFQLFYNGILATNISNLSQGNYAGGYNKSRELVVAAGNPDGDQAFPCGKQDDIILYRNRILTVNEIHSLYLNVSAGYDYPFQ